MGEGKTRDTIDETSEGGSGQKVAKHRKSDYPWRERKKVEGAGTGRPEISWR